MVWESMSSPCSYDQCPSNKPSFHKAKPCSDGWHIIFSDEESGNVCLGVDSHDEEVHNGERFSKVAIFLRADAIDSKPLCYAVAAELSWGPRVVVGYSDGGIFLYSVPADMFRAGRGSDQWDWLEAWDAVATVDGGAGGYAVWPVVVKGIGIGHVDKLADVTIQGESGGVKIWAFSSRGKGYCWGLGDAREGGMRKLKVVNKESGLRFEDEDEVDEDGDWRMRDAPPLTRRVCSGFDGHASPRRERSDVSMHDATEDDDEGYGSSEDVPFDLDTRIRTHKRNCNTPLLDSDESMRYNSIDRQEAIVKSTNKSLHSPPIHRSDISIKDAANGYVASNTDSVQPAPASCPNKRRRPLENAASTSSHFQDFYPSFDFDQRMVDRLANPLALNVPSLKRKWSETQGEDWVPDYLGMAEGWDGLSGEDQGREDVGMDLWGMAGKLWDGDVS